MHPDIATVVGARPQFVKCALVSQALRARGLHEILVHTGQHYDEAMSHVFFRDLAIPEPDFHLGVGSGPHGRQTGEMLIRLEEVLQNHRPRLVLVYGDTNSTLAGALAAIKLGIPVAHVEAGLRSGNRTMPEEHNRIAVDHWADLLLCHNESARRQLESEGIRSRVVIVGDVMRETLAVFAPVAAQGSRYPGSLGLIPRQYAVLTVHRPVNADAPNALGEILSGCETAALPTVFPAHPRVRNSAEQYLAAGGKQTPLRLVEPLGYLDMVALVSQARLVLTDSGGLQKEAFFLGVPCITLRSETEWRETVEAGWNVVIGDRPTREKIRQAIQRWLDSSLPAPPDSQTLGAAFGPANVSARIADAVVGYGA